MKRQVCKSSGEVFPSADEHVLHLLTSRMERGVGSTEIRTKGISGNPSQRIAELRERGINTTHIRRRHPQGHMETLYVLEAFAPEVSGTVTFAIDLTDPVQLAAWDKILPPLPVETERRAA